MTYDNRRYGFDSLRILAGSGNRIWALGRSPNVVSGDVSCLKGTIHHVIVELPESATQTNTFELYDIANVNQIATATPVLVIRPWGAATQGSYPVPVHRQFINGMVVQSPATAPLDVANVIVMYAPSSTQETGWVYVR